MANAYPLDPKKWFDRFQPQTLQSAMFLLYFRGFLALVDLIGDQRTTLRVFRAAHDLIGWPVGLAVVAAYVGGGFLMANDRRLGWYLAIGASLSPFVLRGWLKVDGVRWSWGDVLTGGSIFTFIVEAALVALVLHTQSRNHARLYYR